MKVFKWFLLLVALVFLSHEVVSQEEFRFLGSWSFHEYDSITGISTFTRVKRLKNRKPGFEFAENGIVIVRTNALGCSVLDKKRMRTSSTLNSVEGNWVIHNGSTLVINYSTFQGFFREELRIENENLQCLCVR